MPTIPFNPTSNKLKHTPEETKDKPEETKDKPEETKDKPEETKDKPEETKDKPEETKDKPEKKTKPHKGATQRRKLKFNIRKQTKRVRFNLSGNSIKKYYCPEMQPKWVTKIESGNTLEGDFKAKQVPSITLKELFT